MTRCVEFFNTNPTILSGLGTLNPLYHTEGTYSQNCLMDYRDIRSRNCILEHFTDSLEFQSWKVNFKTEVCAISVFPQITLHWIKEAEIAKSINDLLTSRSITGRRDFTEYEMLDARIASTLKNILTSVHFRREVSVEEQRAQKDDRFLRGRQIAYMIYEILSGHRSL